MSVWRRLWRNNARESSPVGARLKFLDCVVRRNMPFIATRHGRRPTTCRTSSRRFLPKLGPHLGAALFLFRDLYAANHGQSVEREVSASVRRDWLTVRRRWQFSAIRLEFQGWWFFRRPAKKARLFQKKP